MMREIIIDNLEEIMVNVRSKEFASLTRERC